MNDLCQPHAGRRRRGDNCAQINQLADDSTESLGRGRRDFYFGTRGALALGAEIEIKDLKTSARIHRKVQRAAEHARIEQMALQPHHFAFDRDRGAGFLRNRLCQPQRQAFGPPSGFHEFAKGRFGEVETRALQAGFQFRTRLVEDDAATDVDGVAGKVNGIRFPDDDTF